MATAAFDYPAGNATCRGSLSLPTSNAPRPGVAVFADIGGIGDHTIRWAERLAAECGMVALAADVYGEGAVPADIAEGMAWLSAYRVDPPKLVARAGAALTALAAHPRCDKRLAVIGFCFGGSTVLELARASWPELRAGVSFHGGLSTPAPAAAGTIGAALLVCHGAEDPLVPPAELAIFLAEMATAGADCQTIAYSGAVHSFTNRNADGRMMPGIAYHEGTDRRAWRAMVAHFVEVFGD